ncbi:MAG: DUF5615 family PIN-like protein [Acidobacteriota bacterium]|nr:DUF5615 family PIN-like protein [Acidobacteriota bacterium]
MLMQCAPALVEALRTRGIDVDTALEAGREDDSDEAQLAYATTQSRALYPFNIRDFMRLHTAYQTEGQTHAGLILAPQQRYSVGEQMRRLLRLVGTISAEEMRDRVEFLSA